MLIKASAPGSIMLLGEYAVLQGGHALVCAIDQRIHVQLQPRVDDQVHIISSLGTYKTTLSRLEITSPLQFVLAVLKKYQRKFKQGCTLTIESGLSDQMGLASSAAVTVATLSAVTTWLGIFYSPSQVIRQARHIVQAVQGLGSGADVAACVLGGIVAYRKRPFMAEKMEITCSLALVYSGHKTPTVTAVKQVETLFSNYPSLYNQLLRAIDECALQGIAALRHHHLSALGQIMNIQQGLLYALGVSTPVLQGIVEELREKPTILGAKISGSGLGDSIVALGDLSHDYISRFVAQGAKRIPLTIATQGVCCEKIGCD